MKPAEFPEQNTVFAKDQPEYLPLPAFVSPEGAVITFWQLEEGDLEKIKAAGGVWMSQLTFNKPLQPQGLFSETPFIEETQVHNMTEEPEVILQPEHTAKSTTFSRDEGELIYKTLQLMRASAKEGVTFMGLEFKNKCDENLIFEFLKKYNKETDQRKDYIFHKIANSYTEPEVTIFWLQN